MSQTTEKIVVSNLKSIVNGILIEDMNWNTLMRLISNKQNLSELIKLPVEVFNSVAFKYL